jgi:hypothetical protein
VDVPSLILVWRWASYCALATGLVMKGVGVLLPLVVGLMMPTGTSVMA